MCFTSDVVRYGHGIPLKAAAGLLRRPETTDERRSSHFVCLLNRLVNSSSKRERGLLVGARERERGRERESFIHWTKSISDSAGTPATGSNASAPAPNQRQGTSQRHWKVNEGKLHKKKTAEAGALRRVGLVGRGGSASWGIRRDAGAATRAACRRRSVPAPRGTSRCSPPGTWRPSSRTGTWRWADRPVRSTARRNENEKKNNRKLDALSTFVSRPPDWSMDAVGHGTPPPFVPHFCFPLLVPGPTIKHGPCCVSIARPLIGRWSRKGKEIPPLMSRIMSFYFFRKSGRVANQGLFS